MTEVKCKQNNMVSVTPKVTSQHVREHCDVQEYKLISVLIFPTYASLEVAQDCAALLHEVFSLISLLSENSVAYPRFSDILMTISFLFPIIDHLKMSP